jgi:hypothetical protein
VLVCQLLLGTPRDLLAFEILASIPIVRFHLQ